MRWMIVLQVVMVAGCAVNDAQMKLADQVLAGIELCGQGLRERDELLTAYQDGQRKRLDEAFDADVRERAALSADWVIEHRRMYASAMDLLAEQRAELAGRAATDEANIAATRAAVERIRQLAAMQRAWWRTLGGRNHENN